MDEEFGDGWAWDVWEGMGDSRPLADVMEVAASCFVGMRRFVVASRRFALLSTYWWRRQGGRGGGC